ncbi:hypothetical protein E0F15_07135 [Frankia sp. B2]|nr:hypothetical protein E0F15_07135 [Frankia sp. B2]
MSSSGTSTATRARISHIYQNYVRAETHAAANAPLIAGQADIATAQAWGGAWSPRSTAPGSSCRSARSTPGRTRSTSAGVRAPPTSPWSTTRAWRWPEWCCRARRGTRCMPST